MQCTGTTDGQFHNVCSVARTGKDMLGDFAPEILVPPFSRWLFSHGCSFQMACIGAGS